MKECPECGETKYYSRFHQEDHNGLLLYDRRGDPKKECRYAPDDGTIRWKRQLYMCAGCGITFDRRTRLN